MQLSSTSFGTGTAEFENSERQRQLRTEEQSVAVSLHLVTLAAQVFTAGLLDILVPLAAFFIFGSRSAWLQGHVKEQLNFQLTFLIVSALVAVALVVLGVLTFGVGLIVLIPVAVVVLGGLWIVDIICSIKAAMAASRGESYRFPFSLRLIR